MKWLSCPPTVRQITRWCCCFSVVWLHLPSVTRGRCPKDTQSFGVQGGPWHGEKLITDDLILSDPAVPANSASLSKAPLFFPRMSLSVHIQGKNNFVRVLGKGFTISEMSLAPNFHCTLTAAPFHRVSPTLFKFSVHFIYLPGVDWCIISSHGTDFTDV